MILILPLGLGMAYVVNYSRTIRLAVVSVEAAGGKVTFDYQMDEPIACFTNAMSKPVLEPPGPRWLRRMIGDEWFSDVAMISFDSDSQKCVTDDVLRTISTFRRLQVLIVPFGQITDVGLEHLRGLDRLRALDLSETSIGDRGLSNLTGLKNLEILELDGTQVTGAGLSQLVGLNKLSDLYLSATWVDDEGMSALARLTGLTLLTLSKTRVAAAGLARLSALRTLESLYVSTENLESALRLKRDIPGLDVAAID